MELVNDTLNTELIVTTDINLLGIATRGARVTKTGHLTVNGILDNHLVLESGTRSEINGIFNGNLELQANSKLEIKGIANIHGKAIDPESVVIVHAGAVISGRTVAQTELLNALE